MSKELDELKPNVLLKFIDGLLKRYEGKSDYNIYITKDWLLDIKQALTRLESIDNANPSEALEILDDFKNGLVNKETGMIMFNQVWFKNQIEPIKQALLKAQEQEKENELLKEIIKSLFDGGCPLHQYTDKEDVLTIEVDDDCSIMRLGEFKGVDLDKKLKEVLG